MWSIDGRDALVRGRRARRGKVRSARFGAGAEALECRLLLTVTDITNPSKPTFATIQAAIDATTTAAGDTLQIDNTTGIYSEAVTVDKSVTLMGTGNPTVAAPSTGTNQTVFHVTAPNVTIENLNITVNQLFAAVGILADQSKGDNFTGIKVLNDTITSSNSGATLATGFGTTGAAGVALLNGSSTIPTVTIQGNTINNSGDTNFFADGIWLHQVQATVGGATTTPTTQGNKVQGSTADLLFQISATTGTAHDVIQNNSFTQAGVSLVEPAAGTTVDVLSNTFQPPVATYPQELLIQHNFNTGAVVNVTGNTFSGFGNVALFSGASHNVVVTSNTFTPAPGSTTALTNYDDILMDTSYPTTGAPSAIPDNSITVEGNTFNAATNDAGRALDFQNNNPSGSGFGALTIGGAGALANTFKAGINQFIRLTPTQTAPDTAAAVNPAPFSIPIDASQNLFDLGTGPALPSALTLAQLYSLEDKIQHKVDDAPLGFVTVVPNNVYVTVSSFLPPDTTTPSIQRGVNAAPSGGTVHVQAGTFNETVVVSTPVTIQGAQSGVDARTRSGAAGTETLVTGVNGGFSLQADHVVVNGFTVENATGGAGVTTAAGNSGDQVLDNIIENNVGGVALASNGTNQTVVKQNLITNNNQTGAGGGDGIFSTGSLQNVLIDSNTINTQTSAAVFLAPASGTQSNVTVSNNQITNVVGVELADLSTGVVTGNTLTGNTPATSAGVIVAGNVSGLAVTSNNVLNFGGEGVLVNTSLSATPNSNVTVHFNRFFGNTTAGVQVVAGAETGTLDATNNWWGSNAGPNAAGNDKTAGDVNASPWLVLNVSAVPASIGVGRTSTVTADLTRNSAGQTPSTTTFFPNGVTVAFTATGGTVSPASATTASGKATAALTATVVGTATASAKLDNQTVTTGPVQVLPLAITPASLPNTTAGQPYTEQVTASGGAGAFTYSLASGTLPTGLTLNTSTGSITGTPTTAGPFTFTIKATDTTGGTISQSYTVTINQRVFLDPTILVLGVVGIPYSTQFIAMNGTGALTFSVTSGSLPPGLSLSSTGLLSGTPTTPGSSYFTVTVTDQVGATTSLPFPLVVAGNQPALPTVVDLQRLGVHLHPTSLVLTFNTPLNPTSAADVSNYQVFPLIHGRPGNDVPITSAVYDATSDTVTLTTGKRLNVHGQYELTVNGQPPSGVSSASGIFLGGAGNGVAGTNLIRVFGPGTLVRSTSAATAASKTTSRSHAGTTAAHARAVDAALAAVAHRKKPRG